MIYVRENQCIKSASTLLMGIYIISNYCVIKMWVYVHF